MKLREIYTSTVVLFLVSISYYFEGFFGLFELFISLTVYGGIGYLFYFGWKKLRKKPLLPPVEYIKEFLYKVANIVILLFVVLGGFLVYHNEYHPATMELYTLSNGKKTIQFQSMIHIGKKEFYDEVASYITQAKKDGYVLYFEGVKPGTEENMKRFNEAIGIKFEAELYENFSKLYGVEFQENEAFLGLVNTQDFNIDVSIDDIMTLYDAQHHEKKNPPEKVEDLNKIIVEELAKLDERKLKVLVYVNKGILNFLIKNDTLKKVMMDEFGNQALFDVILHERNKIVSNEILTSEHTKIFITYGQLHFEGIFELLKSQDPNWKIISQTSLYPITSSRWK